MKLYVLIFMVLEDFMYISRSNSEDVLFRLAHFPAVAITGPRQCGKSTLARHLVASFEKVTFLDLERPDDNQKLNDPQLFLSSQKDSLICIDEVQRKPELFPLIRTLIDEWNRPACFLLLGSASRDLLKQSSESLAGRISYTRLTPFLINEIAALPNFSLENYLERGGFPRSFLADSNEVSRLWRDDFISTFLERDLMQWRNFSPQTMRRLWQMLAHSNGQTSNYSAMTASLGISTTTVRNYIDLLASTYMVDIVEPYSSNLGKRLVKSPKVYLADSGITLSLLQIRSYEDLLGHPGLGALWEQVVLTHIKAWLPQAEISFYRSFQGSEFDFVIQHDAQCFAIECKMSSTPTLSKGNYLALEDIKPDYTYVVTPQQDQWPLADGIEAISLPALQDKLVNTAQ